MKQASLADPDCLLSTALMYNNIEQSVPTMGENGTQLKGQRVHPVKDGMHLTHNRHSVRVLPSFNV